MSRLITQVSVRSQVPGIATLKLFSVWACVLTELSGVCVLVIKGITSRICWLLFVNTTFKVGPSSPTQSACASGGPTCLQSGTGSRISLPACSYWLGATDHCPKVDDQKCPEHSKIRKYEQRAGSLQIQTPPHTFKFCFEAFFQDKFLIREILNPILFQFTINVKQP